MRGGSVGGGGAVSHGDGGGGRLAGLIDGCVWVGWGEVIRCEAAEHLEEEEMRRAKLSSLRGWRAVGLRKALGVIQRGVARR